MKVFVVVAVAAAALSGCASGRSRPSTVEPALAAVPSLAPSAPAVIIPAPWELPPGAVDGRRVQVRWLTSKCALFHAALVEETADSVTITVQEEQVGDGLCPNYRVALRDVVLAAPLGSRALLDGSATPARVVR